METLAPLIAGVYVRCSHDKRDGASISEQEAEGRADCHANSWEPRLYDADNDRSASRFSRDLRPDWDRLTADLRAGLLAVVVLWETSRGDRKAYEWLGFLNDCRDRGVLIHVHTHHRTYDVRVARDWRTLADDGIDNAYESEKTSLRVKRDLAAAAAKGRPHGQAPYGYIRRYHPVTRAYITQEPDPLRAPVAAGIITRIARSEPLGRIRDDLNARGIPAPAGGTWDRHTLRLMGLNPAYAGRRRTPDGDLIEAWPPIVPLEVHLAAAAVLTGAGRAPRPGRQRHLLSYLALCGPCGAPLWVRPARGQYSCQARGHVNVTVPWLDELVTLAVLDALSAPDAARMFRGDNAEAAAQRAEAAALRAQLDQWAASSVSPRAYQIKEAQLLPKIERADRAAAAAEVPLVLRDLVAAEDLRAGWDTLAVPARRDVIRSLMTVRVARAASQKRADITDPARVIIEWKRDA